MPVTLERLQIRVRRVGELAGGSDGASFNGRDRARFKGALSMGDLGAPDLYYMRNRWYEPSTSRFLSEDPIGLAGGINLYVFAGNNPVSGRDPTGLQEPRCGDDGIMCGVGDPPVIVIDGGGDALIPDLGGGPGGLDRGLSSAMSGSSLGLYANAQGERTFRDCVAQNTAPVREFGRAVGGQVAAVSGTLMAMGGALWARGRTMVMNAFLGGSSAAFVWETTRLGERVARPFVPRIVRGGGPLLRASGYLATAVGGFAASYFITSAVTCAVDPEYGND